MEERVLVLGGGAAGLSAAVELARAGRKVILIEARDRLGGRIQTIAGWQDIPIDLGAEFIHGKAPQLWKKIRAAGLQTHSVPDKHWTLEGGKLVPLPHFWEDLEKVTDSIRQRGRDLSFAQFLRSLTLSGKTKELARDFVEGFHAAPLPAASAQAVGANAEKSEEIDGTAQFRLTHGYRDLIDHLAGELASQPVKIHLNTMAREVRWKNGEVTITTTAPDGSSPGEFQGSAAIVTLPISILKQGKVTFVPALEEKREALDLLEMGVVRKAAFQFKKAFWPERNFGFIHSADEWFPAWWSDERGDLLTGWAGADKGRRLSERGRDFIVERGLEALERIFGKPAAELRELLVQAHCYNWLDDPFSLGAYSFIKVGGINAPRELSRPMESTLFFAGEATSRNMQLGTVHGAIESGERAARELIAQAD